MTTLSLSRVRFERAVNFGLDTAGFYEAKDGLELTWMVATSVICLRRDALCVFSPLSNVISMEEAKTGVTVTVPDVIEPVTKPDLELNTKREGTHKKKASKASE